MSLNFFVLTRHYSFPVFTDIMLSRSLDQSHNHTLQMKRYEPWIHINSTEKTTDDLSTKILKIFTENKYKCFHVI